MPENSSKQPHITPTLPFCLKVIFAKFVQSVARIDKNAHIALDITLSTDPDLIAFYLIKKAIKKCIIAYNWLVFLRFKKYKMLGIPFLSLKAD